MTKNPLLVASFAATIAAMTTLFVWISPQAEACIHKPPSYKQSMGQSAQEALLIHADGVQDLILKVNLNLTGSATGPDKLAWIVTVPTKPTSYKITKPALFKDLFRWRGYLKRLDPLRPKSKARRRAPVRRSLRFDAKVKVGAYTIQPVRGSKKADAAILNKWLTDNGFEAVDTAQLGYFLERKFTFLCIKIDLKGARQLSPLRVTFPSKKLYYPLKFSAHQGTFNLHLYTITKEPLSHTASASTLRKLNILRNRFFSAHKQPTKGSAKKEAVALLNPYGWQSNAVFAKARFPTTVRALLKGPSTAAWHVNYLKSIALNADGAIKRWKKDIFLTLGETAKDKKLKDKKAAIAAYLRQNRMRWPRYASAYQAHMLAWARSWQGGKALPKQSMVPLSWWLGGLFGIAFLLFLGVVAARRGKVPA